MYELIMMVLMIFEIKFWIIEDWGMKKYRNDVLYKYICYEWLYGLNKKIEKVFLFLGLNLEGNLLLCYWV